MRKKLELKLNNSNNIYYNCNKCLSYNMFFNIIFGGRGIGKTTTYLIQAINDYNKDGSQFIYLRRYKTESVHAKTVLQPIVDGVVSKGIGNSSYALCKDRDILGYVIPLSTGATFKSVNFDRVNTIIFDEALLPKNSGYRYLSNEIHMLFEFISTVFRHRKNCKVYVLGNNIDMFNPYFSYFNIPTFNGIFINKERGIYCEMCKDKAGLRKIEEETPLFKLVNGTQYGKYHYDNEVLKPEGEYIVGEKESNADLKFRLVLNDVTLNIYGQYNANREYILYVEYREKIINDNSRTFVLMANGNPSYYGIKLLKENKLNVLLRKYHYLGKMIFSSEKAGAVFLTLLDLI